MIIGIHMAYLYLKGDIYKELIPVALIFGLIEIFGWIGIIAVLLGK
jgi:hypothetical protein